MKVSVKHGKNKYPDLDLDPDAATEDFKAQMFSLTGVEPERQKIMVKGTIVKDEPNWSKYKLKEKMMLMMMGTPSGNEVKAPEVATVFLEDQEGGAAADEYMPPGLENISNTCYMNATIQCLGAAKELRTALVKYKPEASAQGAGLTTELSKLYEQISATGTTQQPMAFWSKLRADFPQFNEQVRPGAFAQQDADDCWNSVMTSMTQALGSERGGKVLESLFWGEKEETMTCEEDADEPATKKSEKFWKLPCKLNRDIAHINMGVSTSLESQVEKNSEKLGREAVYKLSNRVKKLPYYLTVQMMRFEWNAVSGNKAKIIRECQFNLSFDAYDLCTPELQAKLRIVREAIKDAEDKRLGLGKYVKVDKVEETRAEAAAKAAAAEKLLTQENAGAGAGSAAMETETSEAAETPAAAAPSEEAAVGMEVEDAAEGGDAAAAADEKEPAELVKELTAFEDPEMPENKTGWYELVAILTHKGQNADGGHYVAWVQHKGDTWVCFDDDKVTECRGEELPRKLDGGTAHNHMSYMMLYRSTLGERANRTGATARSPRSDKK